jgi:uncharacterized lipoprotein YajG
MRSTPVWIGLSLLASLVLLAGCATAPAGTAANPPPTHDVAPDI